MEKLRLKKFLFTARITKNGPRGLSDIERIASNLFQASVKSWKIKVKKSKPSIRLKLYNTVDPEGRGSLWALLPTLIKADSTAKLEIQELNSEGDKATKLTYSLSDIEISIKGDYASGEEQEILVKAKLSGSASSWV